MKRNILGFLLLCMILILGGCKGKDKEFVMGDNELIHLTSTPRGEVETYQIYTTNIMIYVDGTVKIYASDFVRWFGYEEIPELTFSISKEEVEQIKQLIITENIYNLREDVGNKDGISGTVKHMTVYGREGTNTTGGISVSNRQFVRAYDRIEAIVREELYIYTTEINETQYEGFLLFNSRKVEIKDRKGNVVLNHESVNNVYCETQEVGDGQSAYYTVVELNPDGWQTLRDLTLWATKEDVVVLALELSGSFETNITITGPLNDGKIYIPQESEEAASNLSEKIKSSLR